MNCAADHMTLPTISCVSVATWSIMNSKKKKKRSIAYRFHNAALETSEKEIRGATNHDNTMKEV